jgi:hypothetical protein
MRGWAWWTTTTVVPLDWATGIVISEVHKHNVDDIDVSFRLRLFGPDRSHIIHVCASRENAEQLGSAIASGLGIQLALPATAYSSERS